MHFQWSQEREAIGVNDSVPRGMDIENEWRRVS